jgi:hypothetical protein
MVLLVAMVFDVLRVVLEGFLVAVVGLVVDCVGNQ